MGSPSWDQCESVFESVAGAVDTDGVAVAQEAVQDGGGEDVVAEDVAPFGEALVAGDDHAAAFVAAADELEDHVRFGVGERQVADFVDLSGYPHRWTYADTATIPSIAACSWPLPDLLRVCPSVSLESSAYCGPREASPVGAPRFRDGGECDGNSEA